MVKTPAEKWKDAVVKYRKQCQKILEISDSVRYAGIVNTYGRTLTGMIKPNLKPLLQSEDFKNELFVISTLISLRKNSVSSIGKLEYVVLQHQKITILVLQKNDVTFYVSINRKEKGLEKIISSIKKTI
ncbi:hypothetical protein [Candidatus Nitrosopumilus sediminis]|uniref:Roadblock/LAMTOR2 domain-containing protein n=1 Tax=Candidatus Nitrosopumilus sediminis TaxID=1229909 RepID=K0B969_9ARCH|nr:hypothetical protein [Candidatus Nitrosopumilus sediminis]AFS82743.1 hypothetical protein NSED_04695 [Candidatus Nitrosopumilus sediminis]